MIKISNITLYKVGEVVEILEKKYNYRTLSQTLCKKATMLNAYVAYNNIRYIPENIICHLTTTVKQQKTKTYIQAIIHKKLENIREIISMHEQKENLPPMKAITRIKSNNYNTKTIVQALIQLKEEMIEIQEKTQEEIKNKGDEITTLREEIKNKSDEITALREQIKKIQEKTQEETQDEIQIRLLKEVKSKLNNLICQESKNISHIKNKKNICSI
ncbi:hypothetical protein [Borrelia persica]|uniref:hypothetical protein n=1 Tax=Borrelia persica TaxID=44448 RepID=UPI000463E0CB|nr:hypothetical protein [Borrelia persica]